MALLARAKLAAKSAGVAKRKAGGASSAKTSTKAAASKSIKASEATEGGVVVRIEACKS